MGSVHLKESSPPVGPFPPGHHGPAWEEAGRPGAGLCRWAHPGHLL